MRFDVIQFLDRNGIYYRTSGKNCKKGNVVIDCPFCAHDDGQHLGIDLNSGQWGCWRDSAHRGKNLAKLISKAGNIPYREAAQLVYGDKAGQYQGFTNTGVGDGTFDSLPDDIFGDSEPKVKKKWLNMPKEFEPIKMTKKFEPYLHYLESRGFDWDDLEDLISQYDLRAALEGEYKGRIITPIYMLDQLTGWTGRSIWKGASLRYRNSNTEESVIRPDVSLLNYDDIWNTGGADVLVLVEGPWDAIKVDFYGKKRGIRATCLFTKIILEEQSYYLADLVQLFEKVVIMLDPKEVDDALMLEQQLSHFDNVEAYFLDKEIEDPGAMTKRQVARFCKDVL